MSLVKFFELVDNKKKFASSQYAYSLDERWLNTDKIIALYPYNSLTIEKIKQSENLSDLSNDTKFCKVEYEAGNCIQSFIAVGTPEIIAKFNEKQLLKG